MSYETSIEARLHAYINVACMKIADDHVKSFSHIIRILCFIIYSDCVYCRLRDLVKHVCMHGVLFILHVGFGSTHNAK